MEALPKGALILGIISAVTAVSGFAANKVIAHFFGAGPETDALLSALTFTQTPVDLLILGGVIGPFLPLFIGLKGEAEQSAQEFARTILTAGLAAMMVALGLIIVFAPELAPILVPGFQGGQRDLYVGLVRVLSAGQLAITASLILGEVLVAERRFISYGLADCVPKIGMALGAGLLGGLLGMGIYGVAIGFLFGAAGHLGVHLVGIFRTTFRPKLSLAFRTKGVGEFAVLMLPKMASMALLDLLLLYFNNIASTLAPGSTSALSYANEFRSTTETVIGLSFAVAAFPALSAAAAAGDKRAFKRIFRTNALTIGFLSVVAAIALAILAGFISNLFRGGAFDDVDVQRMTLVLAIYALSVPFECLIEIFARGIFATHNTTERLAAIAAGFVAGVATTMLLSGPIGLAALPLGYVAFRAVDLIVLAIFIQPRIAHIGGASRWSRALVHDRWGGMAAPRRRQTPIGQVVVLAIVLMALTAGTLYAGAQALSQSSLAGAPQVTPWARVGGTRAPVIISTIAPSIGPSGSASGASPSAQASGVPGVFSMDLYQPGDFVSESKDTWCIPAAMQTSMNMMSSTPDTSRDTQARLFDLAVSLAGTSNEGADPDGWAAGLSVLGYGHFQTGAARTLVEAVHIVAKQIRLTSRPGGFIVWKGWHSWVVSGFTATADPATTDNFTVLSVDNEDVWYPRVSTLWPKSRPPDSNVLVSQLPPDYVPWVQYPAYPSRDGLYVYVIPQV
jgi:putative peptidoglycan lipid II flippase